MRERIALWEARRGHCWTGTGRARCHHGFRQGPLPSSGIPDVDHPAGGTLLSAGTGTDCAIAGSSPTPYPARHYDCWSRDHTHRTWHSSRTRDAFCMSAGSKTGASWRFFHGIESGRWPCATTPVGMAAAHRDRLSIVCRWTSAHSRMRSDRGSRIEAVDGMSMLPLYARLCDHAACPTSAILPQAQVPCAMLE